jgi:Transglutaminase-like superfamily
MAADRSAVFTHVILIFVLLLLHQEKGLSQDGQTPAEVPSEDGLQSVVVPPEWTLVDEVDFDLYLEAGKHFGIRFDQVTQTLETIAPTRNYELAASAKTALDKAPQWVRHELTWVFSQIPGDYQDLWAGAINDANDPYIDEIAFSIAHSSPQYLTSDYGSPDLFVHNAELIYENDTLLDYVEVIDYGTSDSNDNYYSTTRYVQSFTAVTRTGTPQVTTVDAPRDIYYWYVVHPKVSSEIPAFIDPNLAESNWSHNDNMADSPIGRFWRDYLLHHADSGYPVLRDRLSQCSITGDGTSAGGNHAIGVVNNWINASMSFTSEGERPHQPIRIYDKHIGRCGEYADLTAAAARTALIPCTSVCSTSTDHIWNEFWHERWIQWEPVNNSMDEPLVYQDGWGKVFGTVYEIRSDGQIRSVTDRYSSETATIDVNVTDAIGVPVDGAEVRLYIQNPGSTRYTRDFYALTDNEGQCSFLVGDGLDYYARVSSPIGNEPNAYNERIELALGAVTDQRYAQSVSLEGLMPVLDCNVVEAPTPNDSPYQLVVSFAVTEQLLMGDVFSDDVASYTQHLEKAGAGQVDFFMTDAAEYERFLSGSAFGAFNRHQEAKDGATIFAVPTAEDWHCIFSNEGNLNNLQHLVGTVTLYAR